MCGDRFWRDARIVSTVLTGLLCTAGDLYVIEGGAKGADTHARDWTNHCNAGKGRRFDAEWERYGKAAGPKRNQRMVDEGDPELVIAFHNDLGNSRGTLDMVRRARKKNIPVYNVRSIA